MNISIITIYDRNPNYGNRLQNYALHTVLAEMGISAKTISYGPKWDQYKWVIKRTIHKMMGYSQTKNIDFWKYTVPKILAFEKFNQKYIPSIHISSVSEIAELKSDYYLVGSDQVWNVNWFEENDLRKDLFFLSFCSPEQKISISPSFGFDEVPSAWSTFIQEQLLGFEHLSVREESGADIIKQLTGRDAPVLIDPTMMLDPIKWRSISQKPKKIITDKPYILTYFLGDCPQTRKKEIEIYAQNLNAKIYKMQDVSEPNLYITDPGEFLYLIDHARLILTDSFHACVFSFLFGKPFLVYDRAGKENGMISRITTLLNKFDLQRKYRGNNLENGLLECDYKNGFSVLENEKEKFLVYLRNALSLDKEVIEHEN